MTKSDKNINKIFYPIEITQCSKKKMSFNTQGDNGYKSFSRGNYNFSGDFGSGGDRGNYGNRESRGGRNTWKREERDNPNHIAISVNKIKDIKSLKKIDDFEKTAGKIIDTWNESFDVSSFK